MRLMSYQRHNAPLRFLDIRFQRFVVTLKSVYFSDLPVDAFGCIL